MRIGAHRRQAGLTLVGLIFVLIIISMLALVAMKVFPTYVEYSAVKRAIVYAKNNGSSVKEIQTAFDRQAEVGYIDSVRGRDLNIVKTEGGFDVSFEYDKKIPLVGPASLLLEYSGTTARNGVVTKKTAE